MQSNMTPVAEQPFRLSYHVVIAFAIACIAPFTGWAWPFALLTGLVIARDDLDRRRGIRVPVVTRVIRILAVTGGVLAMMVAGSVLGGIVAFFIMALVVASERMTAEVSPADRMIVRLLLVIGAVIGFFVLGSFIGATVALTFGS